ncbi:hypothetical protein FF1_006926 [Malus domestica]
MVHLEPVKPRRLAQLLLRFEGFGQIFEIQISKYPCFSDVQIRFLHDARTVSVGDAIGNDKSGWLFSTTYMEKLYVFVVKEMVLINGPIILEMGIHRSTDGDVDIIIVGADDATTISLRRLHSFRDVTPSTPSLISPHLMTWQILFRARDDDPSSSPANTAVVCLNRMEEDVA